VYGYKTLVDEESGRILGVHLVGRMSMVINFLGHEVRHGPYGQ
jgi:hypothetical protein